MKLFDCLPVFTKEIDNTCNDDKSLENVREFLLICQLASVSCFGLLILFNRQDVIDNLFIQINRVERLIRRTFSIR